MDAVRRYKTGGYGAMIEDEDGQWVRHDELQPLAVSPETWQPISSAPKGSGWDGPQDTRHPDYVQPPRIIGLVNDEPEIVYWDWYYAEGGSGYVNGQSAWVGTDGNVRPTHWMPLPSPPGRQAVSPAIVPIGKVQIDRADLKEFLSAIQAAIYDEDGLDASKGQRIIDKHKHLIDYTDPPSQAVSPEQEQRKNEIMRATPTRESSDALTHATATEPRLNRYCEMCDEWTSKSQCQKCGMKTQKAKK